MSTARKDATALHRLLMERFPKAFPKDYDAILPLKLDIDVDIRERLIQQGEPVDPDLLRRVLANHVGRAGYLLALIHRRDGRRYDLDGKAGGRGGRPGSKRGGPFARRASEAAERRTLLATGSTGAGETTADAPRPHGSPNESGEPPKSSAVARRTSATGCATWSEKPPRSGRARRPSAASGHPCRR